MLKKIGLVNLRSTEILGILLKRYRGEFTKRDLWREHRLTSIRRTKLLYKFSIIDKTEYNQAVKHYEHWTEHFMGRDISNK
jgi:hypothetical protein